MVRNYVKKGLKRSWSDDSMRTALDAVINKGFSINKASGVYKVPHTTLTRKVSQCRLDPERQNELLANPKAMSYQTVFTTEQENILCKYISELENANVVLLAIDIRRMAFQLAEKFNIPHRFKKDSGSAGDDWYRGFLKRNPHITVRRGAPYEKSKVFSKEKVYKFFDSLENLLIKNDLKPCDIFNLDETVITCSSRSTEDSENSDQSRNYQQNKLVTAVISFSASGLYAPLLMVFPDKIKNKPLLHGAPHGAWALVNSSGQMQLEVFITWLQKFINFKKPTPSKPVLILIDGYQSYLKDLQVLKLMTENGVHMLCLPPNCTSRLQPLKYSFIDILSKAYKSEVIDWTMSSDDQAVSIDEVFRLFGQAFMKVATIQSAESSFFNTGIWPCNRDLFKDDFITVSFNTSSAVTDCHSISDSPGSVIGEEFERQLTESDAPIPSLTTDLPEPMIVISQNNNQSYEMQETNEVDETYDEHSVHDGHFLQIENDEPLENMEENIILPEEMSESSIVIPPEAQLTEVQLEDLELLAQSQRKLYFYVSPYKLKLS